MPLAGGFFAPVGGKKRENLAHAMILRDTSTEAVAALESSRGTYE
jgi:hypothetical protein